MAKENPYLDVQHLTKSFGSLVLFHDLSFSIAEGQKVGLIAKNGTGKSTLLSILSGKEGYDEGDIIFRRDLRVGMLEQTPDFDPNDSVLDACFNHQGNPEKVLKAKQVLTQLKIRDLNQPMRQLSGGQQKRVALANVLITDPDLLILDEPTNHLDIDMIEWLENYLKRSYITLLMVTHDRYFLDHVCQDILEIDNSRLYHYRGNYDYYVRKKAERQYNERIEVEKAKSLYRTELDWMRRMPQARGTKAQARIDAFYELEAKAHTRFDDSRPQLTVKTERIGGKILELYNICYRMSADTNNNQTIIDDYSYVFKRGEKIGIVGPNGVGKSTFLNIITE